MAEISMSPTADPYSEFDDIKRNGAFVSSRSAVDEMRRIARCACLSFTHNPGGGEYSDGSGWRCQISTFDDVADLNALRRSLDERGPPPL
jgi:hypothetical protein